MATTAEAALKGFIAKFDPANQRLIRAVRKVIRRRLPTANELVYDNYNFLVIAYCPTEKTSDSHFSIAADAHGVNLAFGYNGTKLPDPNQRLVGTGKLNRLLRVPSAKLLDEPDVQRLITAAVALGKAPPAEQTKGALIIRSISPKQRPRR